MKSHVVSSLGMPEFGAAQKAIALVRCEVMAKSLQEQESTNPRGLYRFAFVVLMLAAIPPVVLCLLLALPFIDGALYDPPKVGEAENDIRERLGEPYLDSRNEFDELADVRGFAYQATWIAPNGKYYAVSFDDNQVAQKVEAYSR